MKNNKGFTLLEILVVITMLGIMATLIMNTFMNTLSRGRDSRRKQDLDQIARALELYYAEHSVYPTAKPEAARTLPWGFALNSLEIDANTPTKFFMKKLPNDPSNTVNTRYYYYESGNDAVTGENYYKLFACLENDQDPDYTTYNQSCGTDCSNCHYAVSSPNSTLDADIKP